MTNAIQSRITGRSHRRGAALYVCIVYTALLVSLLGLAGLTVLRIERKQGLQSFDVGRARCNARSGVQLGLTVLNSDSSWRSRYTSGQETARRSVSTASQGTVSWMLQDLDGSLSNSDAGLRLLGIGRVGAAVQVCSVGVSAVAVEGAEGLFLQQDGLTAGLAAQANIKTNARLALSFRPTLPASAVSWRVTRVAFQPSPYSGTDGQLAVSVRQIGIDGKPSTSKIAEVVVLESTFVAGQWLEVAFANADGLDVSKDHCIVLEGRSGVGTIALVNIGTLSLLSPQTGYFFDNAVGVWSEDATKDVWIKVWGTYSEKNGVQAQPGTWLWDSAPGA
jgi:hypothetical protein